VAIILPTTVVVGASPFVADTDRPELQNIALSIPGANLRIQTFTHYSYNSHFLTPSDGWSFTVEDDIRIAAVRKAAVPGAEVVLSINDHVQACGFIDSVDIQQTRDGGTTMTIEGRDKLGQVVDASADPTVKFAENQTLLQILTAIFAPFGFDTFSETNDANVSTITGSKRGVPTTKRGKPLQQFIKHQLKPYPKEGCFAFASRIAQRLGLWIWLSADGTSLVVGKPNFTPPADYQFSLIRTYDGGANDGSGRFNNILSGGVKVDMSEQPDVMWAEGFSGGAEFGHSRIRKFALNPLTAYDKDGTTSTAVAQFMFKYQDPEDLVIFPLFGPESRILQRDQVNGVVPPVRVAYCHDDESKTPEELENFVRREMSLKTRRALTAHYTVEGHTQGGAPWCVDTMVKVRDDVAGIDEPLYVLSRAFEKSRSNGTVTHLELIRPRTLLF
jgi:prophage tail gpP-like protein